MGTLIPPIISRLLDAMNRHDIDALADCFDGAYRSEQPGHPMRDFAGREQVRRNWRQIFEGVPDFRADLVRCASDGEIVWTEWAWHGRHLDRTAFEVRGVMIFRLQGDRIILGRLYMDTLEAAADGGIDEWTHEVTKAPAPGGGPVSGPLR